MSRLPSAGNRVRHLAHRPPIHNLQFLCCRRPLNFPLISHLRCQPQRTSTASIFTAAQLEKSLADERLVVPPRPREKEPGYTLSNSTPTREVKTEKEELRERPRLTSQPPLLAPGAGIKDNGEKVHGSEMGGPRVDGSQVTTILRIRKHAVRREWQIHKHVVAAARTRGIGRKEDGNGRRRGLGIRKRVVSRAGIQALRRREHGSGRRSSAEIRKQVVPGAGIKIIRRRKGGRGGRGSRTRKHIVAGVKASRSAEQLNLRRVRNLAFSAERKRKTLEMHQYQSQRLKHLRGKAEMPEQNKDADGQIAESDMYAALQGIGSSFASDGSGASSEHANDSDSKASAESNNLEWGDLPLSPLMHPQLIKARTKFRQKKPLPSKDLSEFETKIAKSPYGKGYVPSKD